MVLFLQTNTGQLRYKCHLRTGLYVALQQSLKYASVIPNLKKVSSTRAGSWDEKTTFEIKCVFSKVSVQSGSLQAEMSKVLSISLNANALFPSLSFLFFCSYVHLYAPNIWDGDRYCQCLCPLFRDPHPPASCNPLSGQSFQKCKALSQWRPWHTLSERPRKEQRAYLSTLWAQNWRGQTADAPQPVIPPKSALLPSMWQPKTARAIPATAVLPCSRSTRPH